MVSSIRRGRFGGWGKVFPMKWTDWIGPFAPIGQTLAGSHMLSPRGSPNPPDFRRLAVAVTNLMERMMTCEWLTEPRMDFERSVDRPFSPCSAVLRTYAFRVLRVRQLMAGP
jgi:hypothetical protein